MDPLALLEAEAAELSFVYELQQRLSFARQHTSSEKTLMKSNWERGNHFPRPQDYHENTTGSFSDHPKMHFRPNGKNGKIKKAGGIHL